MSKMTSNNNDTSTHRFPEPPERPICHLCFLPLPLKCEESVYIPCCGKTVCGGCFRLHYMAMVSRRQTKSCAFCRQPLVLKNDPYHVARLQERIEKYKDPKAMNILAGDYRYGNNKHISKNPKKYIELLRMAANLGHPSAAYNLSLFYKNGYSDGSTVLVEVNLAKQKEFLEVAAYEGAYAFAWFNLGCTYWKEGDMEAAMYHFRTSAAYGDDESLETVKIGYMKGNVSKEEFESSLRAWKAAKDDMTSAGREAYKAWKAANDQKMDK